MLSRKPEILQCATPAQWLDAVPKELGVLLIDHANCEKKAAMSALAAMNRYAQHEFLLPVLSRLAREELRHFEQVLDLMRARDIEYLPLSASRYARGLHEHVRPGEPERLLDTLLIGALIEARSCERFAAVAQVLDDGELARFYEKLLASEERHYLVYLDMAQQCLQRVWPETSARELDEQLNQRLTTLAHIEQQLICTPDPQFRFHSGLPVSATEFSY